MDGAGGNGSNGSAAPNSASLNAKCPDCCAQGSDAPGSALWLESFAADGVLEVGGVATDALGNALVTRASGETFKFAPDGQRLWSKPFGAVVATDAMKNVYVAGTLDRVLDLGSVSLAPFGDTDAYLVKLDPNGEVVYGVRLGAGGDESVTGLAVDGASNAIVSGGGLGTLKLGPAGELLWQKSFHGHVALDPENNVVLAGAFSRALDLGGGPLESEGGQDIFVAKLDPDGGQLFSRRFGDAGPEQRAQAVSVDAAGNILVSGVFDGSVDFGGGPLTAESAGCAELCEWGGFIAKLDPNGDHLFSRARFPIRALVGITHNSRGDVIVSGSVPSENQPYHMPLLIALDALGSELYEISDSPSTGAGAGHRVAVDPCDNVFWTLSVLPSDAASEQSLVLKLSP